MSTVSDYKALLSDYYWYPGVPAQRAVVLTYSFLDASAAGNPDPVGVPFTGALDQARQDLVRQALDAWASVSGIIFIETKENEGDLNFGYYDLSIYPNAAADAGYPISGAYIDESGLVRIYGGDGEGNGGVIRIDQSQSSVRENNFLHVLLHEIGHSLGLKHPHDGDVKLNETLDNGFNTVMSYEDYFPYLGVMDVEAIQAIYGDNSNDANYPFVWSWDPVTETLTQNGTTAAEYIKGSRANDVIYSSGGRDAIYTYAGDDIVYSDMSFSEINFGPGIDRVIYSQSSTNYQITEGNNGFVYIHRNNDFSKYERLFNIEILEFSDQSLYFNNYMPALTDMGGLFASHAGIAKGTAAAYEMLLGGIPNRTGFDFLIENSVATNFGSKTATSPGQVFNDENIYINTFNALYQGNADAKAAFGAIVAGGASVSDKITLVYVSIIPQSARSDDGLAAFKAQLWFFEARAGELGIAGPNSAALVAFASLTKIAVDNDIAGIGDSINDFMAAVAGGSALVPGSGSVLTALEIADGTVYDGDDGAAMAPVFASFDEPEFYASSSHVGEMAFAPSVSTVGFSDGHDWANC